MDKNFYISIIMWWINITNILFYALMWTVDGFETFLCILVSLFWLAPMAISYKVCKNPDDATSSIYVPAVLGLCLTLLGTTVAIARAAAVAWYEI